MTKSGEQAERDPLARAVWAVGIAEIIAWGTTVYALGVLGRPISLAMGWSQSLVFGGMTAGLMVAAAVSARVGRFADRRGGRIVMTIGFLLSAAGLTVVASATSPVVYVAGWLLIGPAMRMILYDSAFTSIVQVLPSRGRLAISYLTLFGGLASTIFWPIGHWLEQAYGWRGALIVFALLNLALAAPLVWWGLGRREAQEAGCIRSSSATSGEAPRVHPDDVHPPLEDRARVAAMLLFIVALASNAFVFGALAVHLVTVLQATGLALATAVWIASLKGIAQVAGRLWELTFGQQLPATTLGRLAIGILPLSVAVLLALGGSAEIAIIFTLVLGVSNGLVTIVRGAVPLALFGREGYGELLGVLAAPQLFMNAVAPFAYAALVEAYGARAGLWALLGAAILSALAMELTALWVGYVRSARVKG